MILSQKTQVSASFPQPNGSAASSTNSSGCDFLGSKKLPFVPCLVELSLSQFRRVFYTNYKDSLERVGWPSPIYNELIDPGTDGFCAATLFHLRFGIFSMFYHAAFAFGEYLFLTILLMEDIPHHWRCRKTLYKMMNSPYQTGGGILPSNCMSLTFESSNLNLTLEGKIAKKALTSRRSSWAKVYLGISSFFALSSVGLREYLYVWEKGTTPGSTKTWCHVQILESSSSTGAMCSPSVRDVRDHNLGWIHSPKLR